MRKRTLLCGTCFAVIFLLVFQFIWGAEVCYAQNKKLPSGLSYDELEGVIQKFVTEHKQETAGVAVAVFDSQEDIFEGYYGYADMEKNIAMDENAIMDWGSNTKLLVWTSVMQLWEQGKIDLNVDIKEYLPEDFADKLEYEKPVTMENLMNHQGGFQEMLMDVEVQGRKDVVSVEEILIKRQPQQVFEPGTITAYSNWGVGLAAYVVETISGQSFEDYVREHIFAPLGLKQTVIGNYGSLNQKLWEKRKEVKCYNTDLSQRGNCFYYFSLYPVGGCMGTLKDFRTFAKAFVVGEKESSPLFAKNETLKTFQSASSYYSDKETARMCHGFISYQYGVETIGHGGNSSGCSSQLLIDQKSGVGMVIMTNVYLDSLYQDDFPEVIYGQQKEGYTNEKELAGSYMCSRAIFKGPLKIQLLQVSTELVGQRGIYGMSEYHGRKVLEVSIEDFIQFTKGELLAIYMTTYPWIGAMIWSLLSLVVGIAEFLWNRRRKKHGSSIIPSPEGKWNCVSCGSVLLLAVNLGGIILCLTYNVASKYYFWQFILSAILGILMVVLLIQFFLKRKTYCITKGKTAKCIFTAFSLAFTIISIWYWQIFMFWKLT